MMNNMNNMANTNLPTTEEVLKDLNRGIGRGKLFQNPYQNKADKGISFDGDIKASVNKGNVKFKLKGLNINFAKTTVHDEKDVVAVEQVFTLKEGEVNLSLDENHKGKLSAILAASKDMLHGDFSAGAKELVEGIDAAVAVNATGIYYKCHQEFLPDSTGNHPGSCGDLELEELEFEGSLNEFVEGVLDIAGAINK